MTDKSTHSESAARPTGVVNVIWDRLARPFTLGLLLILVGLVMLASVVTTMPGQVSSAWWVTAFRSASALQNLVFLSIAALGSTIALIWNRVRFGRGVGPIPVGDAVVAADDERSVVVRWAPLVGVGLMVLGLGVTIGDWATSQRLLPPSRITVPAQQKIESYPAITATSAVKVMLPSRVYVRAIDVANQTASLEFLRVGDERGQGQMQTLAAFDPVEIRGFRWSVLGVEYSDAVLAAVVEPTKDGAIPAMGTVGDTLQFEIEGPTFKVTQITRNFLGVLGPAVELENDELGKFWVFSRAHQGKKEPEFDHGLKLSRIERAPVVMLAVSEAPAQNLMPVGGILFVVGLALFLLFPDLLVRRRGDELHAWSMNEASNLGGDDE